ncbi:type II toxin-antitoxin system HicB family antitoxin [bacterium]|nr:type II toxin-antitoxin system HicB family antitoxin [bacterium]
MKELKIAIEFWKEGGVYVARCPELDVLSQGYSLEEAKKNLFEVIEIQFEEMEEMGTLDEFLEESGFNIVDNILSCQREIVGFDKSFIKLECV